MSLVLLLGLSPTLLQAAALTEQQIQAIMNLVRSFSADEAVVRSVQLSLEGKTPVIAPQVHIQTPPKIGCIMLTTNLRYRMEEWTTGGQISLLQDFLKTRGLFKQKSNGFFGVTTLQAVNKFQESVGLSSTGFVGPLTRGKIKEQTCGGVVVIPMRPPIGKIAVLSPNGGETWQKGTTQTIKWNSNLVSIPEQPIIYDISLVPYCPSGQVCATYAPFAIAQGVSGSTYTWNVGSTVGGSAPAGSYTVQICQSGTTTCDSSDSFFTIAASYTQPSITVLSPNGGEYFRTGAAMTINWKTANVPASHTFDVIRLRAYPNGQEYNLVHNIANDGQEIITIPSSIPIGTYTLEIKSYFNGVLVMDASDSYFKIVSADSTNLPPVVDGVSGPTSLKVGETGTWTIKARDPENGALSYSVDWGDGVPRVFITNDTAASPFVQQPSTFTHSYATAGRYNVKFTVTDDKGLTAQSSITVQVGSTVPPITVLSPNGGETWQKGTTQTIKWNSNLVSIPEQPIIYDISLVPYCPSGQVCATYAPFAIAQGVSGSTYNWTVGKTASGGDIPAGQYKVTISSAANGSVTDQSDSAFTIAGITTQSTDTSLSPEAVSALAEFSQKKNLNLASILAAIAQLIEAFK